MLKKTFIIIISALLYLSSPTSWSSCAFKNEAGYITSMKSLTMPINRFISVPPDIPVGNEIYRLRIALTDQGGVYVACTSPGQYYTGFKYATTPLLPTAYSNTVYETGVPGIGVKFVRNNDFPSTQATTCTAALSCGFTDGWSADTRIVFIKTASTVMGGVIDASQLPTALYSFGQSGNMLDVYKITLTGSLQINTPTCDISTVSQAMTVNMGNYHISAFSGKGSATGWKNANIQLANCGQFYGNVTSGYIGGTFNGTTTSTVGIRNNFLSVTLYPQNGTRSTTDAANGIMKIDDGTPGATGVGIQLSSSESTSGLIDLTTGITQILPKDGTRNITVPLYARYIQTENSVTAGKANGRLEYVITYQ